MALRAQWKGNLKFGELLCPVALHTAASTAERVHFHLLNRKTGNRLHREFVDSDTGATVERDDQVKGYELENGTVIVLEPEEIAAALPQSDRMLAIRSFVRLEDVDDVYFDKPYYLVPGTAAAGDAYRLLCEAMTRKGVVAIAEAVLFRRLRTVLIRPQGTGLIATTLNFDYEVRSAADAFEGLPETRTGGEMLDLARHIIKMKSGKFDPATFDDRYDTALRDLVKAKREGRALPRHPVREPEKVTSLLDALRQSAGAKKPKRPAAAKAKGGRTTSRKPATRKAG